MSLVALFVWCLGGELAVSAPPDNPVRAPEAISIGGAPTAISIGGAPTAISIGGAPTAISIGGAPTAISVGGAPLENEVPSSL